MCEKLAKSLKYLLYIIGCLHHKFWHKKLTFEALQASTSLQTNSSVLESALFLESSQATTGITYSNVKLFDVSIECIEVGTF